MSSGRKSISLYYSKVAPQTILRCAIFWPWPNGVGSRAVRRHDPVMRSKLRRRLSAAELATRRCAALSARCATSSTRAFVLVTEDQPAFFQIVGRHFDRDPVTGQGLDPVFLHLACGIGNDLMPGVELNSVAGVGEDF